MPAVTILMAVYNGERYLTSALSSLLAQTFRDFDVLVIDDGSTDRSAEIVERASDARIRQIRNERNQGLTRSLNIGLRAAKGRYIARMDADDVSHPERLARQVAFLNAHPDHVLVGSSIRRIDGAGAVLETVRKPMADLELRWVSMLRTALDHSSVTFRRLAPGGDPYLYDERFVTAQDAEMWPRLLRDGKGAVLAEPLIDYRVHETSVTARRGTDQIETLGAILSELAAETYRLDDAACARLPNLWRVLHTDAPFDDAVFEAAMLALDDLIDNFVAKERLTPSQVRFVRARAAGQFWVAALRRRHAETGSRPLRAGRLLWQGRRLVPGLVRRIAHRGAEALGRRTGIGAP
ncbi:MAG: glycosyltransferase family A protein [Pseudomonadota bacterium]